MEPVYRTVVGVARGLFATMGYRIDLRGTEHVPTHGPAVLAANHIGYLDFVFVGYGARESGRLVRFMAKKEIFDHPVAGPLMRAMRHLPVDRFGRPRQALRDAVAVLETGEVIGAFPEGTISRAFVPAEGKTGPARMAMTANAPLIPTAVWGTQRIVTKGRPRNLQRGIAVSVIFGEPIDYEPDDDPGVVSKRLMARVGELVEHAVATYPQRPADDSDRWWLPAHLGGTAPTVAESQRLAAEERRQRKEQALAERRARREAQQGEADRAEPG